MKEVSTVGVIILRDDKVLLVREGEKSAHRTGVYNTPAGRIDANETPMQAAVRELEEESGLQSTEHDLHELPKTYVADIVRKSGETVRFHHTVFVCTKFKGDLKATDETVPEWVKIDELDNYTLLPNIRDMVIEGKKYLR